MKDFFSLSNLWFTLLAAIIVYMAITGTSMHFSISRDTPEVEQIDSTEFGDFIMQTMFEMRIENIYVVYSQILEETNHFTSDIFLENKNLFGMKMPERRATLATGINRGHATFNTYRESIIDYALYQMAYRKGLEMEDYILGLNSYATNPIYTKNIRKHIKKNQFKDEN